MGAGSIHEIGNLVNFVKRIPAIVVVAAMYGTHYDIHTAQVVPLRIAHGLLPVLMNTELQIYRIVKVDVIIFQQRKHRCQFER